MLAHIAGVLLLIYGLGSGTSSLGGFAQIRTPHGYVAASAIAPMPELIHPRRTWLRMRLDRGKTQTPWVLHYSYKITRVDVDVAGSGTHVAGGFDLANRDGALAPGLLLLPESALHGALVTLRVDSVIDPRTIEIAPLPAILPTALQRRAIFGVFVGFYLSFAVFNFLMFLSLRERSFVIYAGLMGLTALNLAISFGTLWQVLPPITFLQRELIFDGTAMAQSVMLAAFALNFLRIAWRDRTSLWTVAGGTLIWFATIAADFWQNANADFVMTFAANAIFFAAIGFASLRAQRAGIRSARYLTAAMAAILAGYIANMLSPYLPFPEIAVFAFQTGNLIAALLLSLALAGQVQAAETLASRDGLTGVLNRRSFDEELARAAQRAAARRTPLGVLLLDIDRFKEYNDRFGHLRGDACLIEIAQVCAACVRSGDVFARYGGEEFAAILPGATLDDVQAVADRMHAAVRALCITAGNGACVSVSIGGATLGAAGSDVQHLVAEADARLYGAKQSGRDCVVVCAPSVETAKVLS